MNKQKNELIIALKQLANNMIEVAELLSKNENGKCHSCAKQLLGASMMVRDWAYNIEFENDS